MCLMEIYRVLPADELKGMLRDFRKEEKKVDVEEKGASEGIEKGRRVKLNWIQTVITKILIILAMFQLTAAALN